jgi:flavin reductase (DIM6/NTAB) family NADH-FMN oxidoreductase RutF
VDPAFVEVPLAAIPPGHRHAWLTSLVMPRPIALVSTIDASGVENLAPFSFFALGGSNPPSLAFCPTGGGGGAPKDTLRNLRETGECVVHLVTHAIAAQVNQASASYPPSIDEAAAVGFTRLPSRVVRPSRIAESPAALECRVLQFVPVGEGPLSSTWVIGEIVALHVSPSVLGADGLPDVGRLDLVARLGRQQWSRLGADDVFELPRPA